MAYNEGRYQIAAMVGILLLGTFVVSPARKWLNTQRDLTELSTASGADHLLTSDPSFGPVALLLKQRFGNDYTLLLNRIQTVAAARDQTAAVAAVRQTIMGIKARDSHFLATAPHISLMRLASAEQQVIDAMPVAGCAAYAAGKPVDFAGASGPLTQSMIAQLTAIADGRDHPTSRKRGDRETVAAFQNTLHDINTPYLAGEVLTGQRTAQQATDDTICDAQRYELRAVQAKSPDQGDRAYLLFLV